MNPWESLDHEPMGQFGLRTHGTVRTMNPWDSSDYKPME